MSATPDERNAFIRELLRLSQMFKQNVALKHGLPMPTETGLENTMPASAATAPTMDQPSSRVPPAPAPAAATSGLPGWVKPALVAGAIALSGGGIGGVVTYLLTGQAPAPQVHQQQAEPSGNLLQWLEDNGQNVPPEWQSK